MLHEVDEAVRKLKEKAKYAATSEEDRMEVRLAIQKVRSQSASFVAEALRPEQPPCGVAPYMDYFGEFLEAAHILALHPSTVVLATSSLGVCRLFLVVLFNHPDPDPQSLGKKEEWIKKIAKTEGLISKSSRLRQAKVPLSLLKFNMAVLDVGLGALGSDELNKKVMEGCVELVKGVGISLLSLSPAGIKDVAAGGAKIGSAIMAKKVQGIKADVYKKIQFYEICKSRLAWRLETECDTEGDIPEEDVEGEIMKFLQDEQNKSFLFPS